MQQKLNCEDRGEDHYFLFKYSSRNKEYMNYQTRYTKIDFYYCTKCLTEKETRREEYSRETPDWFHKD